MGIALFCEILTLRGSVAARSYRRRAGYDALKRVGLLRECGVVQSIGCVDCAVAHDADVVFEDSTYGYWCPEIGHTRLDREDVAVVEADLATLAALMADALHSLSTVKRAVSSFRAGS